MENEATTTQIFYYKDCRVRTVQRDNEPWFVLKDVCDVLGISNHKMVAQRLDTDEVSQADLTDSLGRTQATTIINESGLYSVILRSDKPEARNFRKWITSEVLPSIRKTGGYIVGQETLSPEELMAKALLIAQQKIAERDAKIADLTVKNRIMEPKADYFDACIERNLLLNFRETAKVPGIPPKQFMDFLMEKKFLYRTQKGSLLPTESRNDGYFSVKESYNSATGWSGTQTFVTPKGREAFRLMLYW